MKFLLVSLEPDSVTSTVSARYAPENSNVSIAVNSIPYKGGDLEASAAVHDAIKALLDDFPSPKGK